MQRAARKDANHAEIQKFFESKGYSVLDLSQLKNACDIVVSYMGITVMIEIKDGSKIPSKRKLTEGEIAFRNKWRTNGHWQLIESLEQAQELHKTVVCLLSNKFDWRLPL